MSSGYSDKTLSVFLSILMVGSVIAIGGAAFAGSAAAQQAGADILVGSSSNADHPTVQAAINNATDGDVIAIESGTFNSPADSPVTFDSQLSNVTLKANDSANPPELAGGINVNADVNDLTLENLKLSGDGGASRTLNVGGGSLSNVAIDNVTFDGGESQGAAIYGNSFSGNITIVDSNVSDYTGDGFALIYLGGSGLDSVEITGSTVQDSTGMVAFGEISNSVTVEDNTFSGIEQESGGKAVAALALGEPALGDSLTASISGNTFSDNFNHVALGDVDGETIQSVVNSNDFDRAAFDDRLISPSIQNVVDSADSGDTVSVGPGTYEESIVIDGTNNLTLQGVEDANGNSPVIVGDGANVGSQPHATIQVDGNGPTQETTIEGFTIRNPDGHYGVYAGTGGSNTDVNGFVLRNNIIEDIATNISSHNPLAGSVSGLYVRAQYDSITVEDNTIRNVNTKGDKSQNAVGLSFSSFIGNKAFADTDSGSETAENTSVQNNVVTNITGAEGSRTKGISVSGEFDGLTIANNTVTAVSADITDSNILAITLTENPAKSGSDIDSDGTNERIGPRNFEIRDNDIDELSGADEALVFVGGYEDLGDNHVVEDNNLVDTDAGVSRFAQNQSGFNPGDEDTLDATSNWWGDASGPSGVGPGSGSSVSDNVDYAPWLDAADGDETPGDVTVSQVTVGASDTIEIPIDNYPTGSVADFNVTAADGTEIQSGSTNAEPISVTADYNQNGNYTLNLKFGGDGNLSATAVRGTFDTNLTLTPESPVFEDTLTINGELLENDGSAGNNVSVELQDEDGDTRSSDTTTSTGAFSLGSVTDDAGEWSIVVNDVDTDTVDVGAQDVSLSVEANNTVTFEQSSTVTIQLNDSSDNPIDTSNVNGFVNITGPFASVAGSADTGSIQDDQSPEYVRVNTDANGNVTLGLTPNGSDVTVSLENNQGDEIVDGLEDTTIITNDAPDFTADAQSLSVAQLDTLNAQTGTDEISVSQSSQDLTVTVTGGDGLGPAAGNDLVNATVAISGPNVDNETELNGSSDATFPVLPDEAGTITAEVTAFNRSGGDPVEVGPQTVNVSVTGDNFENILPATDPDIDTTTEVGVTVTDTEGTPANVRNVTFEHANTDGFNVTGADGTATTGKFLNISSTAGSVAVGNTKGSLTAVQTFSPDSGEYLAENVSFDETGAVNLTVADGGSTTVFVEGSLDVTGANVYTVESDIDQALVGLNETHNLSISENGAAVNGSELGNINIKEVEQAGDTSNVATVTAASPADTDDDGTNESLQVELRAENATEPLNITVEEAGESRTGSTSISVVEPEISTTLGGDDLTFGLTDQFNVTVEDPRDNTGIDSATVDLSAVNASYQIDEDLTDNTDPTAASAGGSQSVTVNANGTREVSVAPEAGTAGAAPQTLNISTSLDTGSGTFGEVAINTGNITAGGAPDNLEPSSDESLVLDIRDANDEQLDLLGVELAGGGLDGNAQSKLTDEGLINFGFTTSESGTITYTVDDSISGSEVNLVTDSAAADQDASFQIASTNVLEEANLSLSADQTEIDAGGSVDFTLVREDFGTETSGTLTIRNASGAVTNTVDITQNASVAFDTAGEFTVEASKPDRSQVGKTFINDSVDVSVAEAVEPGAVQIDNVNLDPNSVTANTTNDHDLTFDALNVSADNSTDSFTVEIPSAATLESANDVTVTTENVSAQNLAVDGNNITFDVNPDSESVGVDLSVEANVTVSAPNVSQETTADLTINATDSDGSSDSASATLTITVEEAAEDAPANFSVSGLEPQDATVNVSEAFDVSATVENTGDLQGEQEIELRLEPDGDAVRNQTVSLNASENDTVIFDNVTVDTAGEFNHTVASANDSATGSLTVEQREQEQEPPTATVTFENQTVQNGSTTVNVASATFNGSEAFNIVVHQATDDNDDGTIQASEIGKKIGESAELDNGTRTNITVNISKQVADNDNVSQLTENETLVAMLHTTNTSDDDSIVHTAPITRDGTRVFDQADIGIEPESPLDGPAARFDENADGEIDIGELGQAGRAFAAGDLSITELGQVGRIFAR